MKGAVVGVGSASSRLEPPGWRERLQREAPAGLRGALISLGVHALLLLILAIVIVTRTNREIDPGFEAGWLTIAEEVDNPVVRRAPIRLESVVIEPEEARPVEQPEPEPQDEPVVQQIPTAVEPVDVEDSLSIRDANSRRDALLAAGGNEETERAITSALEWLVRQQQTDGRWQLHQTERGRPYPDAGLPSLRTDTGATALALLCFLGIGQTHRQGEHREVVENGLQWLVGIQKASGDLHDHVELGRQTAYYAHSQATIALCEAYALTGDEALREPAERAVAFLLDSQHPIDGGWKYQPQTERTVGDLSVTGWGLMALHTARMAGLDVPADAFDRGSQFLDSVQERGGSRYKYEPHDPPGKVTVAMTAEGLLCRQWLGWPRDYPPLEEGIDFLLQADHYPEWSAGRRNVYSWYYTLQVLHNQGGDDWKAWYGAVHEAIVSNQVRTGSARPGVDVRGSWHPTNPRGASLEYADKAGRLYLTTFCVLILETPFRHLPLYGEPETTGE